MPTYRLDLAYDGSGFHGYARQPNVPTVQESLEEALFRQTGPLETHVAGRTDRGVHAIGQVVSFTTEETPDLGLLMRSLNRQLSPAIAVAALAEVADDFHARFSATGRSYRYRILNRETPDPFLAGTAWHLTAPLDVDAMYEAADALVGEHDFASFCKRSARLTTRVVRKAQWVRQGDLVDFAIDASSFCHQMVRSIVAALVDVGLGNLASGAIAELLAAQDRDVGRGAAPARGLTLLAVEYRG